MAPTRPQPHRLKPMNPHVPQYTHQHEALSPPAMLSSEKYGAPVLATSGFRQPPARHGESILHAMPSGRRFVAGEAFFNYEAFGSLRPEFRPIDLFSTDFLGLAVNAMSAGFVFTMLKYGFRQLLAQYVRVEYPSIMANLKYLLEWPGGFALFIGFLSDCRPIQLRRRKPYMILGWVLACFFFVIIALIDNFGAQSWDALHVFDDPTVEVDTVDVVRRVTKYSRSLVWCTIAAVLMLQFMHVPSLSMTVEFAQRERLQERGRLQALYFVLYYIAAAAAQGFSVLFIVADDENSVRSKLSVGDLAAILAAACLVPVPFLIAFLEEPPVTNSVHFSVRRRVRELWRFCHQNVVIRILCFLCIYFFIVGLYNSTVRLAVAYWSGISAAKQPTVYASDFCGYCLSLLLWMKFMVNQSWPQVAGIGSVVFVLGNLLFTTLVTFNAVRADWFYIIATTLLDMPNAWIKLYAVVLATEIADNGREGVTMGLVYASQMMIGVSAHMFSGRLGEWIDFGITPRDVAFDRVTTRYRIFTGAVIVSAINLLATFLVLVLPQQKLDAQQLRAFGGYNRYASYGIAAGFTVLLLSHSVYYLVQLS